MGTYVYMCIFHILCMEDKNKILIVLNYQLYQLVYLSLGTGKKVEKAFLQELSEPTFDGNVELAKHPLGILANR